MMAHFTWTVLLFYCMVYLAAPFTVYPNCRHFIFCVTLSKFARETRSQTSTDLVLSLQPGTHHLDHPLILGGLTSITIQSSTSSTIHSSVIHCNGSYDYWFGFQSVATVTIHGIDFVNCHGISFINVTNANISRSVFTRCYNFTECLYFRLSTATIQNTSFTNNGVCYNIASFHSTLSLQEITTTQCYCGAMLYLSKSSANVRNSSYTDTHGSIVDSENSTFYITHSNITDSFEQ